MPFLRRRFGPLTGLQWLIVAAVLGGVLFLSRRRREEEEGEIIPEEEAGRMTSEFDGLPGETPIIVISPAEGGGGFGPPETIVEEVVIPDPRLTRLQERLRKQREKLKKQRRRIRRLRRRRRRKAA